MWYTFCIHFLYNFIHHLSTSCTIFASECINSFRVGINDLSCRLLWTTTLFAYDTSLFSVVHDVTQSTNELNDDLEKISNWAYQWKMSFNPDKSKQAQEVIFSHKTQRVIHPPAIFNNMPVVCSSCQKRLGIYLDEKLHSSNILKKNFQKMFVQCPT